MTLLGMDSFSKYAGNIANIAGLAQNSGCSLSQTFTRWGGAKDYSLLLNNNSDELIYLLGSAGEDDVLIIGAAFYLPTVAATELIRLYSDAAATTHTTLALKADGNLEVRRGSGAGTVIATGTGTPFTAGVWHYVCWKSKLHDTTGTADVLVDGAAHLTATGLDTKNAGTKTVYDAFGLEDGGTIDIYVADLVWCNEQGATNNAVFNDYRVAVLAPDGNGSSSALVGSDGNSTDNYALVDDVASGALSSADYAGTAVADDKDLYAMSAMPVVSGTVAGAVAYAFAAKSDAGAKSIALVSRESGGTEEDGATQALSTTYAYYRQVFEDDPDAVAWTISSLNAAQFGAKAKA